VKSASLKSKAREIVKPLMEFSRLVLAVANDVRKGSLRLRAAALTYVTLLSLAPLLAICFSVLKAIGIHNQLKPFLLDFLAPLGDQGRDIAGRLVGFVDNIKVGVLGMVGFLILVYGVLAMMREIELAFNDIWGVERARTLLRRIRDYPVVLLIVPLCMSLSVAVTEVLRHAGLVEKWLGIHIPGGVFEAVAGFIPYVLFVLSFTALYMFMPNTRVRARPALAAGLLATVLWKVLGWLFGVFVVGSGSYAAIYSVFAAMMLFMVWVNTGWLIVLVGASLSRHIQNAPRSLQA
jgi:membrane protein